MTNHSKMILVAALCLGLTAAALAQSEAIRAIYRESASIPTNVEGIHAYPAPPAGSNHSPRRTRNWRPTAFRPAPTKSRILTATRCGPGL